MQVLSQWQTGNPWCEGFWLTRARPEDPAIMAYWTGKFWDCFTGWEVHGPHTRQYMGLAFDPNAVEETLDAEYEPQRRRRGWIIWGPVERGE